MLWQKSYTESPTPCCYIESPKPFFDTESPTPFFDTETPFFDTESPTPFSNDGHHFEALINLKLDFILL
jgi:hypothetical protein